jgi:hypothetical protein
MSRCSYGGSWVFSYLAVLVLGMKTLQRRHSYWTGQGPCGAPQAIG